MTMAMLGVTHRQTLKHYVLKLMSDDKTYYEVKGLYLKNSSRPKVNKKLEVKIYLKNLDLQGMGLWTVRVADARGSEPIVFAHQA